MNHQTPFEAAHRRCFAVATCLHAEKAAAWRAAICKAIAQGTPLARFKAQVRRLARRYEMSAIN